MNAVDRALVLGPGGPAGTAWMAGLLLGLRRHGVDLGTADLTVGTSAGAITAAALLAGGPAHFEGLGTPALPPTRPPAAPSPEVLGQVFAVLGDPTLDPVEKRRRVGRLALDRATPEALAALLAGRTALIGATAWPDRPLLITAVEAHRGEAVVWDRESGVPLAHAVAASSAFPGVDPPVPALGGKYLDGALRAGTNVDLAAGARLVVLLDPMARSTAAEDGDTGRIVTLTPDGASADAIGPNPADRTVWPAAHAAGLRQGAATAPRLTGLW
ncbi:patatin-like phospholipase family protein [Kitasatospora sp. NPDC006697]|uniref:patatin-like phospholipase family protein n=1 Tax=Kitasatospora sp. NPDC006697 TaxID=3364020 RepID=UPI0036B2E360